MKIDVVDFVCVCGFLVFCFVIKWISFIKGFIEFLKWIILKLFGFNGLFLICVVDIWYLLGRRYTFDIGIKYCFEIENILIYKIYCIIYLCKLI